MLFLYFFFFSTNIRFLGVDTMVRKSTITVARLGGHSISPLSVALVQMFADTNDLSDVLANGLSECVAHEHAHETN